MQRPKEIRTYHINKDPEDAGLLDPLPACAGYSGWLGDLLLRKRAINTSYRWRIRSILEPEVGTPSGKESQIFHMLRSKLEQNIAIIGRKIGIPI